MKKPTIYNYFAPFLMLLIGLRQFSKHGIVPIAVIPILIGLFSLYLVIFNHHLLERILKIITKVWLPIGRFIALALLTITFYLLFAPVGLLLRLIKKDILNRNFKNDKLTYWLDRPSKEENNYTQQF